MTGPGSSNRRGLRALSLLMVGALLLAGCQILPAAGPEAPATPPAAGAKLSGSEDRGADQAVASVTAPPVKGEGAPGRLSGTPVRTWRLPAEVEPFAVLGDTLVVERRHPEWADVEGLSSDGKSLWQQRFAKPGPDNLLSWSQTTKGDRLAVHMDTSPVLVLDKSGRVLFHLDEYRSKTDVVPQFLDGGRYLLVSHGAGFGSWFDLTGQQPVERRGDIYGVARAASDAFVVVTESRTKELAFLDGLKGFKMYAIPGVKPPVSVYQRQYSLGGITADGLRVLTWDEDYLALRERSEQPVWRKESSETIAKAVLAAQSGDVWYLTEQPQQLIALGPDGKERARVTGFDNTLLDAVHPGGGAAVIWRSGRECLVTAEPKVTACARKYFFTPDGTGVVEVAEGEARLFAWGSPTVTPAPAPVPAGPITAKGAPAALTGTPAYTWPMPPLTKPIGVLGTTLVVMYEHDTVFRLVGYAPGGSGLWVTEVKRQTRTAKLTWDINYSRTKLVLHTPGSAVIVLDEKGQTLTELDGFATLEDVQPSFIDDGRALLVTHHNGRSRVAPRALEWFDLTARKPKAWMELAYTARAAANAPLVVSETGSELSLYTGSQTPKKVDVSGGKPSMTEHGRYELQAVTGDGRYTLAWNEEEAVLFRQDGTRAWHRPGDSRSRHYTLAPGNGEVWWMVEPPAGQNGVLQAVTPDGKEKLRLEVAAGAGGVLEAVHPQGDAAVIAFGSAQCLVTAAGRAAGCPEQTLFTPDGKWVLEVTEKQARLLAWPLQGSR